MAQRIILNEDCQCKSSDVVAEFNVGDTFKISYRFSPIGAQMGQMIDLNSFDLTACYWIYGKEDQVVEFNKTSISNSTVMLDFRSSIVRFIFRDYKLGTGKLYQNLTFRMMDPSVPGSWMEESYEGYTGINLK